MGVYTCLVILGCLTYANAQLVPHCAAVLCAQVTCPGAYTPPGQCCPECPGGRTCIYKGIRHSDGENFIDECNTCSCMNGRVSCTEIACSGKPGRCPRVTGLVVGICLHECSSDYECPGRQKCCSNGCGRTCTRPRRGGRDCSHVDCQMLRCVNQYKPPGQCCPVCRPPGGRACIYKGIRRRDGENFKDECNTCSCMNGRVSCTEIVNFMNVLISIEDQLKCSVFVSR